MKFSEMITKLHDYPEPHKLMDIIVQADCEVSDICFLDPAQSEYSDGTVYMADGAMLSAAATVVPRCVIYYNEIPKAAQNALTNSFKIEHRDFPGMFQIIRKMLESENISEEPYSDIINMCLKGDSPRAILSSIAERTGDMLAAIDSTGKIFARSKNFYVKYPVWMKSIEQGYCVDVLISHIADIRKQNKFSLSTVPFTLFCKHTQMFINCNRVTTGKYLLGYIFVINTTGNFIRIYQKIIPHIANRMRETCMRADSGERHGDFIQAQKSNIFADVLAGASGEETKRRFANANIILPSNMRVVMLKPMFFRYENFFVDELKPRLEKMFEQAVVTQYQNCMYAIIPVNAHGKIEAEPFAQLRELSRHKHIQIGISNSFTDIGEIGQHIVQCRLAISFAKRISTDEKIFFFFDYMFYVLFDQVEDNGLFAHLRLPALDILSAYDNEKGTELYETLKIYTGTCFNKIKTAELMYLHRNTIKYRIQQIEALCNIDLADTALIFPLQFSFIMDAYLNNMPVDFRIGNGGSGADDQD